MAISKTTNHRSRKRLTWPVFSSHVTTCPNASWRSLIGTPRFAILRWIVWWVLLDKGIRE